MHSYDNKNDAQILNDVELFFFNLYEGLSYTLYPSYSRIQSHCNKGIHVQMNQEYKLIVLGSELERTKHLNFYVSHKVKKTC